MLHMCTIDDGNRTEVVITDRTAALLALTVAVDGV
jgi:hypothetical protein